MRTFCRRMECLWHKRRVASDYRRPPFLTAELLGYLCYDPRSNGMAAFTDRELESIFHRDRLDEVSGDRDVVAGHDHLHAFRQVHRPGDVGRPEIELRPVAGEERGVAS